LKLQRTRREHITATLEARENKTREKERRECDYVLKQGKPYNPTQERATATDKPEREAIRPRQNEWG
jgi:hypothetical protein